MGTSAHTLLVLVITPLVGEDTDVKLNSQRAFSKLFPPEKEGFPKGEFETVYDGYVKVLIGCRIYNAILMEDDGYDNIVVYDTLTSGKRTIKWDELVKRKEALEDWGLQASNRTECTYEIMLTANYN